MRRQRLAKCFNEPVGWTAGGGGDWSGFHKRLAFLNFSFDLISLGTRLNFDKNFLRFFRSSETFT
jgi:hypothetical protein